MAIQNIFVVGAGLMGSGIAQNAITCGFDVTLNDKQQAAVERAQMNIQKSLEREVSKGRMTQEAMDEALTHLTVDSSMEGAKKGDLVIWDAPDLDYICYRVGSNLAKTVIKAGKVM